MQINGKVCLRAEAVGGVPGAYPVRTWCVPGAYLVRTRCHTRAYPACSPPPRADPKKAKPRLSLLKRGFQCPGQGPIRANGCEWLNFRLFYNYLFYSVLKFIQMNIYLSYFRRFS